jgi:hypothetical protein
MKYIPQLVILIFFLSSCNNEKNIQQTINYEKKTNEESQYIIERFKDFELSQHPIFQKKLKLKSQQYYDVIIEEFIDNETGFFKLFGELWDKCFKSERERQQIWQFKIDRYFRSTSFLTFIRNDVNIYTNGINNQRKNGILKILNQKHSINLTLPIANNNSFDATDKITETIIAKIDDEIYDQLASFPLEVLLEFIILGLIGILGAVIGSFTKNIITIIIGVISFLVFFVRSNNRSDEMREKLKTECFRILKSNNIDYTSHLNKNTFEYYFHLEKNIYDANK